MMGAECSHGSKKHCPGAHARKHESGRGDRDTGREGCEEGPFQRKISQMTLEEGPGDPPQRPSTSPTCSSCLPRLVLVPEE